MTRAFDTQALSPNKAEPIKTDKVSKELEGSEHRLPCRGCMANCSQYQHCQGKPWR